MTGRGLFRKLVSDPIVALRSFKISISSRNAANLSLVGAGISARSSKLSRLKLGQLRKKDHQLISRLVWLGLNTVLVLVVLSIVWYYPNRTNQSNLSNSITGISSSTAPIDPLASVNVALTVAKMTNLPEMAAVSNQADSEILNQTITSASNTVIDKPQSVVASFVSNKNIRSYIVQPGNTIASIASQFNVSTNSILWSNSLLSNTISSGEKLLIPPVNGIVYIVKPGDTAASLATKFTSNASQIIADNDAEISGLKVGEQIIIPNGSIAAVPVYSYSAGYAWGSTAIYGFNGYDWGNCTWYVATQMSVPANWGNAESWPEGARLAGWHVSSIPTVGAIAQTPYAAGGLGHVALVDAVNSTGTLIKYHDMNGLAGFDRVGYSSWVPSATFPNYISHP